MTVTLSTWWDTTGSLMLGKTYTGVLVSEVSVGEAEWQILECLTREILLLVGLTFIRLVSVSLLHSSVYVMHQQF